MDYAILTQTVSGLAGFCIGVGLSGLILTRRKVR